jgi:mannose/fructose/N-acetylgalactosamine-specific phosphotransferase system component IIC
MFMRILITSFIGGLINLDVMTIWQVMISRPVVSGPIIGWLCGDVWTGLVIGALMELIWINILPIGTVIPPDASATTIIATAQAIFTKQLIPYQNSDVIIMLSIMCAVPLGGILKKIALWFRWFDRRFVYLIDKFAEQDNITGIENISHLTVLIIFCETFVFYSLGIWLGVLLISQITPLLPLFIKDGLKLAITLLPALGFAAVMDIFGMRK